MAAETADRKPPCYDKIPDMTKPMQLTSQQLADFRRDGFLVIRRMYDPAEMAALSSRIDADTLRKKTIHA